MRRLVVYASAVNLKASDASMSATLNTHGLDKLLDGYGIHMNKDAVFDHGAQFRVQVMTQAGQPAWIRHRCSCHLYGAGWVPDSGFGHLLAFGRSPAVPAQRFEIVEDQVDVVVRQLVFLQIAHNSTPTDTKQFRRLGQRQSQCGSPFREIPTRHRLLLFRDPPQRRG